MSISQIIVSLFSGILFSIGLAISGMMDPVIVRAFLNPLGDWDYSLAFVMIGAIGVTAPAYFFISKKEKPLFDDRFHLSEFKQMDKKLVVGGGIFGVGWGIYGLCPGPAIAQLQSFQTEVFIFILAMALGMLITEHITNKTSK